MIMFIDDHRGEYGVEAICRVLPIAPSTYHHQQGGMSRTMLKSVSGRRCGFHGYAA